MKKIGYRDFLLTVLTLCALTYVCVDIYKYKRRIKQPQQINIENILDHQLMQSCHPYLGNKQLPMHLTPLQYL